MRRPDPSEYHEYYQRYVDNVPEGDIIALLPAELERTLSLLERVPSEHADYRYQSEKWSIKEVVGARHRQRKNVCLPRALLRP